MAWNRAFLRIGRLLSPFLTHFAVSQATRSVQEKAEDYISKKQAEFVTHARTEAERFMLEQVALIEAKVDLKLEEIEQKIDEQIEKEIRSKLRILVYTLLFVVVMSLVSLGYLYIKKRMGL
ncbi:MAG TPA: hypothetical protein VIU33_02760 [Nitrospiria bacterium]